MSYKILVLAGTHERENEFSYPVLDLIKDIYKINTKPIEYYGEDGARKGELWNIHETLSIGKIVKTGTLTKDYVTTLTSTEISAAISKLIQSWSPESIYEPAHTFKGIPQWTSVHKQLIKGSQADFYIDLHSFHNSTKEQNGTALYINSYANEEHNKLMQKALKTIQKFEPKTYGSGKGEFPLSKNNKDKVKQELMNQYILSNMNKIISEKDQIKLLTKDPVDLNKNEINQYKRDLQEMKYNFEKKLNNELIEKEIIKNWGNEWYFVKFGNPQTAQFPYFLFEAVKWQRETQIAVAQFILAYLT